MLEAQREHVAPVAGGQHVGPEPALAVVAPVVKPVAQHLFHGLAQDHGLDGVREANPLDLGIAPVPEPEIELHLEGSLIEVELPEAARPHAHLGNVGAIENLVAEGNDARGVRAVVGLFESARIGNQAQDGLSRDDLAVLEATHRNRLLGVTHLVEPGRARDALHGLDGSDPGQRIPQRGAIG
jgi:hypothetical protein